MCHLSLLFSRMSPSSSLKTVWEAGRRMLEAPKSIPHTPQLSGTAKTSTSHGGNIPNSGIPDFPHATPIYMETWESEQTHGAQFA